MKKAGSIIMALVMFLLSFPLIKVTSIVAEAANDYKDIEYEDIFSYDLSEYDGDSAHFTWTLNENGQAYITKYTGNSKKVRIPNAVIDSDGKKYKVYGFSDTFIGAYQTTVEDLYIDDGISSIPQLALKNWLKSIRVPGSAILPEEFCANCANLTKVELCYGIKDLPHMAFSGLSPAPIEYISLPETIKTSGTYTFGAKKDGPTSDYISKNIKVAFVLEGSYAESLMIRSYGDTISYKKTINTPMGYYVGENEYMFCVKDRCGNSISNATIQWIENGYSLEYDFEGDLSSFNSITTNEKGVAIIDISNLTFRTFAIKVSAEGYESFTHNNYELGETYDNITLFTKDESDYRVLSAIYTNSDNGITKDLVKQNAFVNKNYSGSFSIKGKITKPCFAKVSLVNELGETILSTEIENNNTFEFDNIKVLSLSSEQIVKIIDTNLYIQVEPNDDEDYVILSRINLHIYEENLPFNLKIGKNFELSLPEEMPFVGGLSIKTPGLESLPLTIEFDEEKNSIIIGYNMKDKSDEGEKKSLRQIITDYNQTREDYADILKSGDYSAIANHFNSRNEIWGFDQFGAHGFSVKPDLKVGGITEVELREDGGLPEKIKIDVFVVATFRLDLKHQTAIYAIPIYVDLYVTGSGQIKADIEITTLTGKTDLNEDMTLELQGGVLAAAGCELFGFGPHGDITLTADINLFPDDGLDKLTLKTNAELVAYIGKYSPSGKNDKTAHVTISLLDIVFDLYDKGKGWMTTEQIKETIEKNVGNRDACDRVNFAFFGRSLGKIQTGTENGLNTVMTATSFYQSPRLSSLFSITPTLPKNKILEIKENSLTNSNVSVVSNDECVIASFLDVSEESPQNVQAYYSVFDTETKLWSEPTKFDNNNTIDNYPYLYSYGNDIYAVYLDSVYNDTTTELSIGEALEQQEIVVYKYNASTQNFDSLGVVSSPNGVSKCMPRISMDNGVLDVYWLSFGTDDAYGMKNGTSILHAYYDNELNAWSNEEKVPGTGNKAIYYYDIGKIDDVYTVAYSELAEDTNDYCLYLSNSTNSKASISNGYIQNIKIKDNILTWKNDENICLYRDGDISKIPCTSSQYFLEDNNLYYLDYTYDGDKLGNIEVFSKNLSTNVVTQRTYQDDDIKYFSILDVNDEKMLYFSSNREQKSVLSFMMIDDICDISLNSVSYDEDSVVAGKPMDVELVVSNMGNTTVNSLNIDIKDAEGSVYYQSDYNIELIPGQSETITVQINVDEELALKEYLTTICTENDYVSENNVKSFKLGYADLSVEVVSERYMNNHYVDAIVKNNGPVATGGTLKVLYGDLNQEITSFEIDEIQPGDARVVNIPITQNTLYDEKCELINIEISSNLEERLTSNNVDCTEVSFKYICVEGLETEETNITYFPEDNGIKTLPFAIYPSDATNKDVCYSIENDSIISINKDGTVNLKNYGRTKIKVVTVDSGYEAEFNVYYADARYTDVLDSDNNIVGKELCKYYGNEIDYTIPTEVDGYKVISIGDYAFDDCNMLNSVTVSENIQSINTNSFTHCKSLTCINVVENNKVYSSNDGVLYSKDGKILFRSPEGKTSATYYIKNGTEQIYRRAFYNCEEYEEVITPSSLVSIGQNAFAYCDMSNIIFNDGLKDIYSNAFMGCANLKEVFLPESVSMIQDNPFVFCSKLERIVVNDNNASFSSVDGVLMNKDKTSLLCYPAGNTQENYIVPSTVNVINNNAFSNCQTKLIEMGEQVTEVNNYAFYSCSNLESLIIKSDSFKIQSTPIVNCKLVKIIGHENTDLHNFALNKNISYFVFGDVNYSGTLASADYNIIVRYAQCLETLTIEQCYLADLNFDGAVDAFDAIQFDCVNDVDTIDNGWWE